MFQIFFWGSDNDRFLKKLYPTIEKINEFEDKISSLSDKDLGGKTEEFKSRLKKGEMLDDILPEAFAVVREVSKRTTGLRHYDVQLLGGIILHKGNISEMRTGEGKTLVATLSAYLNALTGKGVHVVTVNDYLARRDSVWMGQIYSFLGLTIGVVNGENTSYKYDPDHKDVDQERDEKGSFKVFYEFLRPVNRVDTYKCDIVYGTNNEFVFDYLRDNIEYKAENVRHRHFSYAIVDEVDSILIDEARNPLIISTPSNVPPEHYIFFANLVKKMEKGTDFEVDEKLKAVSLTSAGIEKAEKALGVDNLYVEGSQKAIHYLENAIKARVLFKKDRQYVVRDGKIVIVDEFTGRMQPGRQWREGLHQAIEAKEGVKVQQESRTYASITFQNYFRMYDKLSGMTGTAITSAEEFYKVYGLEVISVPTNKDVKRTDHVDLIYQTKKAKLNAVAEFVADLNKKGQPVLVGTASIEHNEELEKLFKKAKVPCEVLNAKNHEREGEIIAQAGRKGNVTIATNLAGRGVDIVLGGNPFSEDEYNEVKKIGGLYVVGTERHEARRIDDQLRGRAGRQGDEGETQFFISLEDDLTRVFGSDRVRSVASALNLPEDQAISSKIISKSIESAQKRIEGHHFDSRRFSLEYDNILNDHRSEIYKERKKIVFSNEDLLNLVSTFVDDSTMGEIKSKVEEKGEEILEQIKLLILQSIDFAWVEHLELMDYARNSASLRSYGQRDPLIEYKKEGAKLFSEFWVRVNEQVKRVLPKVQLKEQESE